MFFERIDTKNDHFSLFRHLQCLVSLCGPDSLLWPFRGGEQDQTQPGSLSLRIHVRR